MRKLMGCVKSKEGNKSSNTQSAVASASVTDPYLQYLNFSIEHMLMYSFTFPSYLHREWDTADRDHSGSLSLSEIIKLLHTFNIKIKDSKVGEIFKVTD